MIGQFAFSKAGHDKQKTYVIIAVDEQYVYLSDGRLKKVNQPKRKKVKHIQIVNRKVEENLLVRLINKEIVFDEEIKYAIRKFSDGEAAKDS
ncbi:KOW domain-containing RNA-binding protein [Lachnospiraceae bacterium OttesenSCG-928-D06]|nr:KOW domain-containing RNA-binding protein [Lachnospiraceae bacterium OttesenSCG-928-D06]